MLTSIGDLVWILLALFQLLVNTFVPCIECEIAKYTQENESDRITWVKTEVELHYCNLQG